MLHKITNYTVGIITVAIIAGALLILRIDKNSNQVAVIDNPIITTDQTAVLSEVSQSTTFEANVQNETVLSNGNTELEIYVTINNISDEIVQFSPPIDISIFSADNQKAYSVESSPNTTLFGGPLEPGQNMSGIIYFVVDAPQSESNLTLIYQPNYSPITQTISL